MTGNELLEKLLKSYQDIYDIERTYNINGEVYEARAYFSVTSSKYVLVKKAELWRADCFEHVFFSVRDKLSLEDIQKFSRNIEEHIEPNLVRDREKWPPQNHMYTYITGIFICEDGNIAELKHAIRKFKFLKNYKWTIRGYCEARLLVFDLKSGKIYGSRSAKEMVKGYTEEGLI